MFPYFHIFGLSVPVYGILTLVGIAVGILWMLYNRKFYRLKKDDTFFFALYCVIFALIGGKVLYIIVEFQHLLQNPEMWKAVITGGMVFYGGVIGGILGGVLYTRQYHLDTWKFFDVAVPGVAIGHGIGRIGCFCAGCCYGAPTDLPIGVIYPKGLGIAPAGVPLLPTQLFEAGAEAVLAVVLFLILRKNKRMGRVTGWYLVLYGVIRFGLEFLRSDPRGAVFGLSTSQLISIFMVTLGMLLIYGVIQKRRIGNFEPKESME